MPSTRLADEYELCRKTMQQEKFDGAITGIGDILKVLSTDGPAVEHYHKVSHFRDVTLKFKEADKMMEAAGIKDTGTPSDASVLKAASLKLVRHLYLVGTRGSQQIWVVSTPKSFTKFPSDELDAVKANAINVKAKLADVDEQFSTETKNCLSSAMQLGRAWCESAKVVLSNASTTPGSMAIVKRWFAANDTSDADVNTVIATLLAGFKKIATALNQNMVIITDMPMYRTDATKTYTEAFVLSRGGKFERPRAIYVEKALFENYDISVLHDMKKNWARVLVHECTHTEVSTQDKGYAYKGIKPGTKITAANAAVNADSWAFFAADCGGALTDGDRTRALDGTGGTLTKLAKNWND